MLGKIKIFLRKIFLRIAIWQFDFWMGLVVKSRPDWNPRQWSNRELRKLSGLFTGDIINVGAHRDGDKEGGVYESYFTNSQKYVKANYSGEDGIDESKDEVFLDLSVPVDGSLGTFDLVFSHTVLEHVYPPSVAFDNICNLSKNSVLIVVPFLQCFHGRDGSYGDYSRFSPMMLEALFAERGFEIVYLNWNNDFPIMNVYIIVLATKNPGQYEGNLPTSSKAIVGKNGPGIMLSNFMWGSGPNATFWRRFGEFCGDFLRGSTKE